MEEKDVEVVGFEALERDVDGLFDAFWREVEVDVRVAAKFGAQEVGIAGDAFEPEAEHDLRHAPSVERGGVDEVHSEVEGGLGGLHDLVEGNITELRAEGGRAEGEDGQVDAGLAEWSLFQSRDWLVVIGTAKGQEWELGR